MRILVFKITMALAFAYGCWTLAGCGDDGSDSPDGGGGRGGSGGSGAMDASDGPVGTVGCLKPDAVPTTCPTPPVTFAQVQPIFQTQCVNACHNGVTRDPNNMNLPIWPLIDPAHILLWEDTIRATMASCAMPPPDAGIPVTIEQRRLIIEWVRCERPN